MAPSSAPTTAEAIAIAEAASAGSASPPLRADAAAIARDLRDGWTGRCLALTGAYVAVAYVVSSFGSLPVHWPLAHMGRQAQLVVAVVYSILLLAFFADAIVGPRARAGGLRAHLFSVRFLFEFAVAMVAVHVTLMMFVNLKQYIPALNERLWDSPLWRLDDQIHLGFSPAPLAHELAAEWGVLTLLDRAYLLFYPVQLLVPLLVLVAARLRPVRGRFFFAYCLVWMVGSAVYIAWPSLGPCYYRAARFLWLPELAPAAKHLQDLLMRDYMQFRYLPGYYEVKLYMGVAALPSLHVAVTALFAMATWRWRPVSIALWALTLVTFAGSLALGWHYAVDGYAGVAIAWLCWWVAGRIRLDRAEAPPRTAAVA